MDTHSIKRWLILIALFGGVIWLIAWGLLPNRQVFFSQVELLLFFGVSVIIPLSMRLALQPDRNGTISPVFRAAVYLHPVVILSVGAALMMESGTGAILLAMVWQVQTLLLAIYGLARFLPRPVRSIEEICIDFGLIYLPISGIWFIAYCADYPLFTFDASLVLLTAVHFTFIGPGALVIAGMTGRYLFQSRIWQAYRITAWGIVISPALVAAGIFITQISGRVWLEAGAVLLLAGSFLTLSFLSLSRTRPQHTLSRVLILISMATLLVTMGFALAYSIGRLTGWWSLSLLQMVEWHGWLNAVGFVFAGLLAYTVATPDSHHLPDGIPFSRLPWRWHMGPEFFQRIGAIEADSLSPPTGIVDSLADYEQDGFDPERVLPVVTAFYEDTAAHELLVYPEWQPRFRLLSRIYKQISKRVGQMNFPTSPESQETHISSAIIALKDTLDGREAVRGWVRVYTDTGQAVYVAAYSSHCHEQRRYMNIAFPLPFGNLTSILRLETQADNHGGLLLTSFSTRDGDQGVYFANRLVPIRLPVNETIRVVTGDGVYEGYPLDFPKGTILAEHKMWIFGLHYLTLHYSITRKSFDM